MFVCAPQPVLPNASRLAEPRCPRVPVDRSASKEEADKQSFLIPHVLINYDWNSPAAEKEFKRSMNGFAWFESG